MREREKWSVTKYLLPLSLFDLSDTEQDSLLMQQDTLREEVTLVTQALVIPSLPWSTNFKEFVCRLMVMDLFSIDVEFLSFGRQEGQE